MSARDPSELGVMVALFSFVAVALVGLLVLLLAGVFIPDAPTCPAPAPAAVTVAP